MGAKATFDPITKLITLTEAPSGGFVSLDVQVDLYSDAKEDWKSDLSLNKFRFPFLNTFGGNLIDDQGTKAGAYYILDNVSGWRLKPYEQDHELIINGNLFGLDPSQPTINPTDGAFTVAIRLNTSSLTQQVSTTSSGLSVAQNTWLHELHKAHFNRRFWDKVGNVITMYDDDGTTVLKQFSTNDDLSSIIPI